MCWNTAYCFLKILLQERFADICLKLIELIIFIHRKHKKPVAYREKNLTNLTRKKYIT